MQLHTTADKQIAELIGLISPLDEATLQLPCRGREKLGDGTIAASARHTADNYQRIAAFLKNGAGAGQHAAPYTSDNVDLDILVQQLSAVRAALGRLAQLTDRQLDAIPPKDSFRFCDGRRTLEQVLASLLKHQGHQVDALNAAIA